VGTRALRRALDRAHYEATQLDAEYARQSIAALVAKAWILAIETRLQRAQAESDACSDGAARCACARPLPVSAVGDEYDVSTAQANVETLRDTLKSLDPRVRERAASARSARRGATLAPRSRWQASLPRWPGDIPAGVPSELLERRPDVVAAERRVAAAFYRTEEAKAARLPRITLVGNVTSLASTLFVLQERNKPGP
jgi:outer membrane protein TolC